MRFTDMADEMFGAAQGALPAGVRLATAKRVQEHGYNSFISTFILINRYRHRLQITYKDAGNFFHQHPQRILPRKIITNFRTRI